ncbi:glycosyltransferase family 4 protein [Pseudomonas sp. BN417]|uniref:glycosyltransferase family 4 protein n=1 Tax=Pseudomonas sp. BN417 TaxID=2567890 RepID=UPI002455211E|nr:glycosyltransferase family 4 protein [Pseudomonas sp. BN417]MDH4554969.1 glycosyltransferase family 4 protein [Pseudomonas sp. BN417]
MTDKKIKILIVTQYFWPENMRINDLVERFLEKGHEVTVLTGVPNYPEGHVFPAFKASPSKFSSYHGADVLRVPMMSRGRRSITLALNYLSFFCSASVFGAYKLRKKEFDSIFVYAVSPIMAAIPALVIGRLKKVPVFVWVLDLWPETLEAVGVVRNERILSLVGRVVSFIYNRADYLLLQSKSFEENVRKYCTKRMSVDRFVYFPSWAEDGFSGQVVEHSDLIERDESVFTIVFAGNVGESQDFPAILKAAETIQSDLKVRWVVVGDGRVSDWLREQISARGLSNFLFLGRHPLAKMPPLFAAADALLVSLKSNEVFEKTIPGKVQAYLASGKPIIAMINGEAARVIQESQAGMACPAGDAAALVEIVRSMVAMPLAERDAMGKSGRAYYLDNYSKTTLLDRLEMLFRKASLRNRSES